MTIFVVSTSVFLLSISILVASNKFILQIYLMEYIFSFMSMVFLMHVQKNIFLNC